MTAIKCDICGKEFKNKAGLSGHMRQVHHTDHRQNNQKPGGYGAPSFTMEEKIEDEPPQEQSGENNYICADCNTPIKPDMKTCPGCGGVLQWQI